MATESDVRRIALSLPETTEKPWFNSPGFRVKDKGFLRIRSEAEGGLVVFVADLGEKEAMLQSEPEKFFTTPHYDGYATVLVDLAAIGLEELRELIAESWRLKAPKRVLRDHEDEVFAPVRPDAGAGDGTTVSDVRDLALALPEATESPHFDMTSFRVRKKIFATVPPEERHAHIFVDESEARACAAEDSAAFEVLQWGERVSGVRVRLAAVSRPRLEELLIDAWRRKAPKRVIAAYDEATNG
jgi:hypothetical protein